MHLATRHGRRALGTLLGLSVVLIASGCFGSSARELSPFAAGRSDEQGHLTVEIQNLNFNDLTVYAVRQGQQIRLGDVTGNSNKDFTVDWGFSVPVQFRIDVVGGQSCRTRDLPGDPGGRIWIQVPANIGLTSCRAARR